MTNSVGGCSLCPPDLLTHSTSVSQRVDAYRAAGVCILKLMVGESEETGIAFHYDWDKKAGIWFWTHQSKVGCYCILHIMFGYALVPVVRLYYFF